MTTSTVKRKMGRPPIAGEAMEQISVRLTQQELARIDDLASRLGISRNEALRTYLAKGFKRQ